MSSGATDAQQRRRSISLADVEIDAFLAHASVARVATISSDGRPHVTPLWFLWRDGAVWLYSLVRSRRWTDLVERPDAAVVVDDGDDFGTLRGVEIRGCVTTVGEQPRVGTADPLLAPVEQGYLDKYGGDPQSMYDGRHAWVRIAGDEIRSWDHHKIPGTGAQR